MKDFEMPVAPYWVDALEARSMLIERDRQVARAALEWAADQCELLTGGVIGVTCPPGQPGSYARGSHNAWLDCARMLRAQAEKLK